MTDSPTLNKPFSLPRAIGAFMLSRFALDTALRSPLPFLGVIAAAYGQDASSIGGLSVALTLAGLASPITGVLSQRFGQRQMVFLPLLLFVVACFLMPIAPTFGSVLGLFVLLSITKALFDPQLQAFIGERVPYARRGTVIGIVELSWALSFAIGAPVFGLLVMRISWWAPFVLMGIIAALGLIAVWITARHTMHAGNPGAKLSFESLRITLANPQARWFLLFTLGICTAAQIPYLVYPLWFQNELHLTIEQLGFASIVVGVADLVAEVLTIFVVDRFGKRRSVIVAGVFYALAFGLFYALSNSVAGMMTALFCIYLGFEFTLVASLSIATEMVPQARTAMMGFNTAAAAGGRIIGSLIALPLFGTNRLWAVALACAIAVVVGVGCGWLATAHKPVAVQPV